MWTDANREGVSFQCEGLSGIFERLIQTFKKKKKYINGQELWLKGKKDQEQHEKTISEWKGELQICISPVRNFNQSCFTAGK